MKFLPMFLTLFGACVGALLMTQNAAHAAKYKVDQIRIDYTLPKNPAHQEAYDRLKKAQALERLKKFLSFIRLPRPLPLKVKECDGVANAWYDNDEVTICYEYLAGILKNAPERDLPNGTTRADAILGPFLDVVLHEIGHAVFDYLKVPVFGREEDAADTFSAFLMLQFGKEYSRRLILGSAHQYKADIQKKQVSLPLEEYSDEHSIPAQRFYNVLCIAYGADAKLFADLVTHGYLPKDRSEGCAAEYEQAAYAYNKLIGPYVDKRLAKKILKSWMRDVDERPRYHPPASGDQKPRRPPS